MNSGITHITLNHTKESQTDKSLLKRGFYLFFMISIRFIFSLTLSGCHNFHQSFYRFHLYEMLFYKILFYKTQLSSLPYKISLSAFRIRHFAVKQVLIAEYFLLVFIFYDLNTVLRCHILLQCGVYIEIVN